LLFDGILLLDVLFMVLTVLFPERYSSLNTIEIYLKIDLSNNIHALVVYLVKNSCSCLTRLKDLVDIKITRFFL